MMNILVFFEETAWGFLLGMEGFLMLFGKESIGGVERSRFSLGDSSSFCALSREAVGILTAIFS